MLKIINRATGKIDLRERTGKLALMAMLAAMVACQWWFSPQAAEAAIAAAQLTSASSNTGANSYNTASITPAGNNLVLAWVANYRSFGTPTTPTMSGNGLTWTQVNTQIVSTNYRLTLFRAMGASPSTGQATIDFSYTSQTNVSWSIIQYSGVDTSGTNGSGAVVQNAIKSATSVTSLTTNLAGFASNLNAVAAGFMVTATPVPTAEAGNGYSSWSASSTNTFLMSEFKAGVDTTPSATTAANHNWAGIGVELRIANDLIVNNGTNPGNASAYQNSSDNAINSFTMAMSTAPSTVSTLLLTNTNSASANVSDIHVYDDNGIIGTYEPGIDVLVPTTLSGQTATAATLTFTTPEDVTTTGQNYLITYDIAGGATVGNTMTSRVTAATGTVGSPAYSDSGSATLTVATGNLTVGNGTNPGNASAYVNSTSNAINAFTLQVSAGVGKVSTLTLTSTNSATANVSAIRVYRDSGTIGTYEAGTDILVPATISGQTATAATITFTTPEPVTTSAVNYLIVYDMAGTATVGNTMTARVTAASGTGLGAITYSDSGSATLTVATGNLTVGNGTNPANNTNAYRGNPYGIDGLTLSVSAGIGKINTLTLTSTNSSTTNVTNIYVYRDNGVTGTFEPGTDILVPATISGQTATAATITFTTPEPVTTSAANYLIVYDIANGATVGNTLTSRVTAATGTGLGSITYNDSSSATLTVAQNNLTIGTGTNPSSANAYRSFSYAIDGFTMQMSATNSTVASLTLTTTNSAVANVSNIRIYSDAATVGAFDGSDTLLPTTLSGQTATSATLTFTTPEPVLSASAKNYLIVYDIAEGATVGNTLTARVTAADGYVGVPTYNDTTSSTLTIAQGTLTVGTGTNPANANVPQGSTGKAIDAFTLAMSAGTSGKVSSLTLTNTNSAATNVSNIKVYSDAGTVGTLDGSDTLIPSAYSISSATAATVDFDAPETVTASAKNYLIVYDIAGAATVTNTLTSRVTAVSGIGLGTPTYSDTTSATLTVIAGVCTRMAPNIAVDTGSTLTYGQVLAGFSKDYTITVTNNDNSYCSNSTFAIGLGSETGTTASFNLPSTLGATSTGVLAPGAKFSTGFTVSSKSTGVIADNIVSTINITDGTNHAAQPASTTVKTYVNDPMMHNSITTGSTKWSGSWGVAGGQYGAFNCTTCHVPKTTNIARIKTSLAAPGGTVNFQSKTSTNSFGVYSTTVSGSQQICETCHTVTNYHKGTMPTIASHENEAQNRNCTVCHDHKNGFKPIGGCTKCHSYPQRSRVAVFGQFTAGNSHHIQGVPVTDNLCYQCHWEANSDGTVNLTYHGGAKNSSYPVDLVVSKGSRPTVYKNLSSAIQYTADGTRTQIASINNHCLGCHSDNGNSTQPFADGKTPNQYAWDGTSVNARYSQTGTTSWGKYAGTNITPKNTVTKAFSAHGKASKNSRGFNHDTANAATEDWANNSGGVSVVCYDCHNSHGSSAGRAANAKSSNYSSATGKYKGALLKETIANKGGYTVNYEPVGGTGTNLTYQPGAALCFDCHNNANAGTSLSRSAGYSTPWGYSGTYGSSRPVMGYWDTPYFDSGTFAPTVRYAYKGLRAGGNQGGHFGASSALNTTPQKPINGLCTPCHDPHGVSPTLGSNQQYSVPLLKGTWVTSPYNEDSAPSATNGNRGGSTSRGPNSPVYSAASTPNYHIDQNTFQTGSGSYSYFAFSAASGLQTLTDTQFAGLCLQCHPKADIGPGTSANNSATWKTMDRVHNTVDGWGSIGGNNTNQAHAYTCSKCHTPHNYRLPRLLVTNCLDYKHRNRTASGGTFGTHTDSGSRGAGGGRGPMGGGGDGSSPALNGGWFFSVNASPSQSTSSNIRTCHNVATAGGSGSTDSYQLWNTKSPW